MNNNQKNNFIAFCIFLLISPITLACDKGLQVVGKSSFSVWFWDVYDIELRTENGSYFEGNYPLELELTYKRDIDKEDLVSETQNQWQRFELEPVDEKRWLNTLSSIWPNVKKNDRITFRVCEDGMTQFFFNGESIGKIQDREFSRYFSMIWLDSKGPYPKQTLQLIGKYRS